MTFQAHAKAVLDLLDADDVAPALVVLDGFVPPDVKAPYVLVYFSTVSPSAERDTQASDLTMASRRVDCLAYCHSVGGNAAAARAVAARVRAALLDVAPPISGRSAWPIQHDDGQPAQRDETTGSLLVDLVDVYRLSSVPG